MGKMKDIAIQLAEQGTNVTPEPSENLMELIKRASMIKYTIVAEDCIGCPSDGNCELQDHDKLENSSPYGEEEPEEHKEYEVRSNKKIMQDFQDFVGDDVFSKFKNNNNNHYLSDIPARSLVSCAFVWSHTPEGNDFWKAVDTMWESQYDKMYFNITSEEQEEVKFELDSLLDSRSIYGSFKDKAEWIQGGKQAMRDAPKWEHLGAAEQEALDNILQKIGRILYGEPHIDSWADIAGYSTLVVRND